MLKGLPLGKAAPFVKFAGEVALQPALSQFATMGVTPGTSFNLNSYLYAVGVRALTFGIRTDSKMTSEILRYAALKGIARGFLNGFGKKYVL